MAGRSVRFNGERLQGLQAAKGWTNAETVRKIQDYEDCRKLSPSLYAEWRHSVGTPSLPYLFAITELFKVRLADLVVHGEATRKRERA